MKKSIACLPNMDEHLLRNLYQPQEYGEPIDGGEIV
jgi:hypothetical protein